MSHTTDSAGPHSHLFSVRLWPEVITDEEIEIRGEVRHVLSGEVYYFRDLSVLTAYLADKVQALMNREDVNQPSAP